METNKLSTNDQKIEFNDYFIQHQDASNTQEYMFKNMHETSTLTPTNAAGRNRRPKSRGGGGDRPHSLAGQLRHVKTSVPRERLRTFEKIQCHPSQTVRRLLKKRCQADSKMYTVMLILKKEYKIVGLKPPEVTTSCDGC